MWKPKKMIYTFRCTDCTCIWQMQMSMKDYKLPKICGVCGSTKEQKRIYDVTSIHFTGSGFTKINQHKGDETQ